MNESRDGPREWGMELQIATTTSICNWNDDDDDDYFEREMEQEALRCLQASPAQSQAQAQQMNEWMRERYECLLCMQISPLCSL